MACDVEIGVADGRGSPSRADQLFIHKPDGFANGVLWNIARTPQIIRL
jgi:hypothetical protein